MAAQSVRYTGFTDLQERTVFCKTYMHVHMYFFHSVQVGVMLYGITQCGDDPAFPDLYMSVSFVKDWISQALTL